ncbi:MgtC/SapB family protein [Ktedonobacter robiniae]|uniref:MgtC/SapB/SrpB/YhiD N-terminal domain-containing protein n=1 Tax=Ktedonobacter robiniae TaxID=2778365 RepID=A0ABQ3V5F2_9CHLR|nr:MgtC/SapB family protein [Ktedonobacter robiniae]GHO60166.1 hypothetical protein KSB_86410 [Ktedonobacter robiniae]
MLPFPLIILRLCVALLLGATIGWERENRGQAAGMRTNALVGLGCAFFTIISGYGFYDQLNRQHIQLDPTRIASYVVAGIGFLGGGAIYISKDHQHVKGLTSAAAIWVVAAIGMACGVGMLWEALVATVIALFVLIALRYLERTHLLGLAPLTYAIDMTFSAQTDTSNLANAIHAICAQQKIELKMLHLQQQQAGQQIHLECIAPGTLHMTTALDQLRAIPHVQEVTMILDRAEKHAPT